MYEQRWYLGFLFAALCVIALDARGRAQSNPQPNFRSTVDVLTIETSVRDKAGLPVTDLQAQDFAVTVDGRPRKVVSAVFFKAGASARARLSGGAPPTPRYVSNEAALPGKVIVFAIDAQSIRKGQENALFEAASRMLDELSPADAVGLNELPGPYIAVGRDHSRVVEGLKRLRGRARGEMEVLAEGRNIARTDGAHTHQVLADLAKLLRQMEAVRAPRSVVLISGGLMFDSELMSDYAELQRAAAESRVGLYTILLEQVGLDIGRGEQRPDVAVNPALSEGLASLASSTGGMFFTGIGRAAGVFDRLASELNSFYQLGLESSPADADGKQHDVRVKVSRTGVDVRSPSHVSVKKAVRTAVPRDALLLALQQPTDLPDVALAVTTYSTMAAAGTVGVMVSAEIGVPTGPAPAEWGFTIRQNGKDVVTRRARIAAGADSPRVVTNAVDLPPGDYHLRVAAVDADDRIGVLEFPFKAGYQTVEATMVSDLIAGVASAGQLEPRRRLEASEDITVMVEVLAPSPVVIGGTLELIPAGSARSILSTPLISRPAASPSRPSTVQGRASLAAVPAGRYTVSAELEVAGQPLTTVSRIIEIASAPLATTEPTVVAPTNIAAAPPAAALAADAVMRRAGAYVKEYGGQASLIVGVEDYSQSVTRAPVNTLRRRAGASGRADAMGMEESEVDRRKLVSEFALVRNPAAIGGWLGYRDVIEMDGKRVSTGRDRLQALFRSEVPDLQRARQITDESARYNIGPVSRTLNIPTATLFFFHPTNLPRFTFRRTGAERVADVDAIVIEFHEQRSPTMIMNASGRDVPGAGTLWVNPVDGAVVRIRLDLEGFDAAGSRGVIDVKYRKDPGLTMWVPASMSEQYSGGSIESATTVATYRDFKRFQTSGRIKEH